MVHNCDLQLIKSVLAELETICDLQNDSVVIKLHGFFQTDDRIAIQEITRQLFLEKETANKVFGTFSGETARCSLYLLTFL